MEEQEARAVMHQLEGFEKELDTFVQGVEGRMPAINVIPSIGNTLEKLKGLQTETQEQLRTVREAIPA